MAGDVADDSAGIAGEGGRMGVRKPLDAGRELLDAFDHSARVTEYLVGSLPPGLWQAPPPGGEGRTIAAIVAHMQSVRRMFARVGGAQPGPPLLDRTTSTQTQARRALQQSREALSALFSGALERQDGRIKRMPRRTIHMMLYLVQHDAHHRGQISMLARALGHRPTKDDVMRVWGWKKLP
jgi:uncharacterized damage-inducible protein DinB